MRTNGHNDWKQCYSVDMVDLGAQHPQTIHELKEVSTRQRDEATLAYDPATPRDDFARAPAAAGSPGAPRALATQLQPGPECETHEDKRDVEDQAHHPPAKPWRCRHERSAWG